MPIIKSAKKRVKVAAKRTLRDALKAFSKALEGGKPAEIQKAQLEAVSALDIAVKKDIIHKNKAARQKASLSAKAKTAGAKPAKAAAKPAAKAPVKKAPAKKPAARKTTAKKASK
jgi:ribosomal protein S20